MATGRRPLQVMKWLRKQKFPWNEKTTERAAKFGSAEVLAYCLRKNCPAEKDKLTSYAVKANNAATLTWLREQGYPWYDQTILPLYAQPKLLQCLLENGYPVPLWESTLNEFEERTYEEESDLLQVQFLRSWILEHVYTSS